MTTTPLSNALNGLQQANRRLNNAARNIVEGTAREQNAFRQLQESAFGTPPRPTPTSGAREESRPDSTQNDAVAALAGGIRYVPSLAEEVVQLKVAATAYKANAKLFRAADEILRTTIESLRSTDDEDGR